MREHIEVDGYLQAQLAELRGAIETLNEEHLVQTINHIRTEAGDEAAFDVVADMLRLAHNSLTDPASAACIESAATRLRVYYSIYDSY